MRICVCGWYLEKFDKFYMNLHRIKNKYPIHVVSNKQSDYLDTIDLPYTVRENTGLEWGAYNYYLMNIWNGIDSVLFCHDDIELSPVVVNDELKEPEFLFDRIAETEVDQAYIFSTRHEDVENHSQHGRMVYMSQDFLLAAKQMGGFYYDKDNKGDVETPGYNAGINAFNDQVKRIGGDVLRKIYIPAFKLGKRGEAMDYGQWMDKVEKIIERPGKKLHIGCGDIYWDTHTNIDLYSEKADIKADALNLPIESDSYDLAESHHLIEHLYKSDAEKALKEWCRVLKPGGYIFLSCPDINAAFETMKDTLWDNAMHCVYGGEEPGMKHHYGYSRESLKQALEVAGFTNVEVKTAIGFRPTPSLIAIGKKP